MTTANVRLLTVGRELTVAEVSGLQQVTVSCSQPAPAVWVWNCSSAPLRWSLLRRGVLLPDALTTTLQDPERIVQTWRSLWLNSFGCMKPVQLQQQQQLLAEYLTTLLSLFILKVVMLQLLKMFSVFLIERYSQGIFPHCQWVTVLLLKESQHSEHKEITYMTCKSLYYMLSFSAGPHIGTWAACGESRWGISIFRPTHKLNEGNCSHI